MSPTRGLLPPTVIGAVLRVWWLLLAVVALCALLGVTLASSQTPQATASASLLVTDPSSDNLFGTAAGDTNYVANQVALLELPSTAAAAIALLDRSQPGHGLDAESLEESVSASNTGEDDLVVVSVEHPDPLVAQRAVEAVVQAYRDFVAAGAQREREARLARLNGALAELQEEIEASPSDTGVLRATYDELLARRAELSAEDFGSGGIEVVSAAALPEARLPVSLPVAAVLGGLAGVVPGAALCYLVAHSRRRFLDRFDPEGVTGVPLLSEIPDFHAERLDSDVPVLDAPTSAAAESFRFAATLLGARRFEDGRRVHALLSGASQDGKSTLAANLAITTVESGRRVLAVDGDLGGRGLSFLLLSGRTGGPGLVEVLEGTARLEDVIVDVTLPSGDVLSVLRGGQAPEDAPQLLASSRCQELFGSLSSYDEVLVDVPPLLQVAYAASLARAADGAIVVVPHHSAVRQLEDLLERVEVLGVPLVGYLYNRAPLRRGLAQHSRLVTDVRRRPRTRPATASSTDAVRQRIAPGGVAAGVGAGQAVGSPAFDRPADEQHRAP